MMGRSPRATRGSFTRAAPKVAVIAMAPPVLLVCDLPGSYAASKALVCAHHVGIPAKFQSLESDGEIPKGVHAPFMRVDGEVIAGANAMARFVTALGRSTLTPPPPLAGKALAKMAKIDAAIDAAQSMLAAPSLAMHDNMVSGKFDAAFCTRAREALIHSLRATEETLKTSTYICGDAVTLADVIVCVDLFPAFAHAFTEAERKRLPNVTRWFTSVVSQPHFAAVLGGVPKVPKALAALPTRSLKAAPAAVKPSKAGGGGGEKGDARQKL